MPVEGSQDDAARGWETGERPLLLAEDEHLSTARQLLTGARGEEGD